MSESPFKGLRGFTRVRSAFFNSLCGFRAAVTHEAAFRQELLLALVLVPLAFALPATGIGKALLLASVFIVLIVELLNSAIEATVDRISLDNHELAKRAKDLGSAAVLVSLVHLIAVWVLVLTV